ncbi:MAG: amino acid kinase [Gammaproteobacteria bacterium]|nr:amino acid kinase [Gammaproteobacteria bacterium]
MPWVIKIGGSLYGSKFLEGWLTTLREHGSTHQLVVVPGGGPFADLVREAGRQFDLDEAHAHHMAVLAMQQFGYLMASLCPGLCLASSREQVQACWYSGKTAIWEPYSMVSQHCRLQKSWDVTSDSLAAWLAGYLSVDQMLFVKSSPLTLSQMSVDQLLKGGCIDPVLPGLLADTKISASFMHKSKADELGELLAAF